MDAVRSLLRGELADPHALLGAHPLGTGAVVRAFVPGARGVTLIEDGDGSAPKRRPMRCAVPEGLFEAELPGRALPLRYRLEIDRDGGAQVREDPYRFPPTLGDLDLLLLGEGNHRDLYSKMGAHRRVVEGVEGYSFAVWAPSARGVSLVGDFNGWDDRAHPMRAMGASGVWELFVPGIREGSLYKYRLRTPRGALDKSDPFAFAMEIRPRTASRVWDLEKYQWKDATWMEQRRTADLQASPMAIYEVHLGSWRRVASEANRWLTYDELAAELIPYVKGMGYTHIELLPVLEHPFDGSWGYQVTGYFAASSRFGTPDQFRAFVDRCHQEGIGVLMDWVPAHFPRDAFALARFDGTALYEHADPRQGEHPDWDTLIFNYGRHEVCNFLLASALFWLDQYHIDGLRVDAVSSMLYLDYSRSHGQWVPNRFGGRENLEAIDFLRRLNELVHETHPGVAMIAEESTSWPAVSRPIWSGGLGFGFKWNMGWMHDILEYFSKDPIHRRYQHSSLTFALLYAFHENFILGLSHDEVVHGKRSLLGRMPGDLWRMFANLRALYAYQYAQPGKKMLFMGGELAQMREWNHDTALDWHLLGRDSHRGVQSLVRDLNRIYREVPALWQIDFDHRGFEWIDFSDMDHSVVSFLRRGKEEGDYLVCVFNLTPVAHEGYRVGVPEGKYFREVLNTDSAQYGGSNMGNLGGRMAEAVPAHGKPFSLALTLPPLAGLYLRPEP